MTSVRRGMGRGLAAIIAASDDADSASQLRELPVDLISPNPSQPRRSFDEGGLQALAGSLEEQGVLQPVLVRPKPGGTYELVAGERRWRAAQLAGMDVIPALVRPHDDAQALELALIENMAREDLNPAEEARACATLVEELGLTREEVGRKVGRSRVAVSNLLRLLELPDEVIAMLEQGKLSEGHGRALLLAEDHDQRRRLARAAAQDGSSVRTLEARARASNGDTASAAPRRSVAKGQLHPDQAEGVQGISDALEGLLGIEVRVRARPDGGYHAEMSFSSLEEALELAQRVHPPAAAG